MGATGSGKTTVYKISHVHKLAANIDGRPKFINLVSGGALEVGRGLESCTSEVQTVSFHLDGRRVRLVDTPGFDDNDKSDTDILTMIVGYLSTSYVTPAQLSVTTEPNRGAGAPRYAQGSRLSGVVYMHRISDFRMGGIATKNFRMFRQLCGDSSLSNVAIVTNMWGEVSREIGEGRETALVTKDHFFKPALDKQARILRHHNTLDSAHDILRQLLRNRPLALRIQQEIIDEHKSVSQTGAAEELERELKEKERMHELEVRRVKEEMEAEQARVERERDEMRRRAAEEERVLQAEMLRARLEAEARAIEHERLRRAAEAMRAEAARVEAERQRQVRELEDRLRQEADAARAEQDRINRLTAELQNRPAVVHESGGCIIC
jgi:hypothetical protein